MTRSISLPPFTRCPRCYKLHLRHGIRLDSLCSCGERLWPLVWGKTKGETE